MSTAPYQKFAADELILRDELAIDRTLLANERTLLAYLRSAMTLAIAGASILHFSTRPWYGWLGLACLPVALLIALIGVTRYRAMNRAITQIRRQIEQISK
jgi:putative membrane protein